MTRPPLQDEAARHAITHALDETLVIEAAAGTGKTTELVDRIVRILAVGKAKVDNIVAVTFTEKAAGELKLRLRATLDAARASSTGIERDRLNSALQNLEEARVNTLHGFCADLLRERPVEAGVDPLFRVLTEAQAERLFGEAFDGWLQAQLQNPPEGVRRALRRTVWQGFGPSAREETAVDRLRRAAWELAGWRDFTGAWTRRPFDRTNRIEELIASLNDLASASDGPSYAKDPLFLDTAPARHLAQEIALQRSIEDDEVRARQARWGGRRGEAPRSNNDTFDGWEARLVDLSRDRSFSKARHGRGPGYRPGVTRASLIATLDAFRAALDLFRVDADADLAAALQPELAGAVERYQALKVRTGSLDFLDLLLIARDLVKNNPGVRRGFQQRFTHIFVDEFQDTDPLQAELLLLLAAQDPEITNWRDVIPVPGRLFIVGDPKQSIYRFRRADVAIYREVCEQLIRHGARRERLTTSFRSVPQIQACVNAAFAPVMTGDEAILQADYVPLSPDRRAIPRQPAVIVLPVPEPYGSRNVSAREIEKSLPDAVGAFVEWIVGSSKWLVTERTGGDPVPVAAKHICLLFRRFLSFGEDITQPYVRALEARGVRHVLVGGKTFHEREEVETIRAALAAIEWPDDELSMFATLRGDLFAIGDEELLEWKTRFGAFHPFRIPQPFTSTAPDPGLDHLRPIAMALHALQRLHRRRNYISIADTIGQLLSLTRAHVGLVLRSGGEQALANVLHVAELARQYEAEGGLSFRGFVDALREAAETANAAEAPILEEGSDGVRLMTVHKAKGLEFPIVILADPTCNLSRPDAGRWIDPAANVCAQKLAGWAPIDLVLHGPAEAARDQAEAHRLAYVAATRARDMLVIPAVGDGAYQGGWLDALMPAVYPPESSRRSGGRAPGCPAFTSKDSVLRRPDDDPAGRQTVAPGLHDIAGCPIVWWDPHVLNLGVPSSFGLHRDDLIVKDGDMFAVEERLDAYERWRADRADTIERASRSLITVQTATSWAADAASRGIDEVVPGASDVQIVALPGVADRPHGPRFGSLVHAVLATVPLDAAVDLVLRTARTHGRLLDAGADEVEAAAALVSSVLSHELMMRARAAGSLRRETPVSWVERDGTLIEGVLDLAFDEDHTTVVVDFKTDHELAAGESRYRAQVAQYAAAVSRATGRPARAVLFRL